MAGAGDAFVELGKSVESSEYLDGTNGIQHVGIVARGSTEAAVRVQARHDKVQNVAARQGVGMAEQMQRRQPPVEAIQTQVFGEPVLELVFALRRVSAGLDGWELARPRRRWSLLRTVSRLWT